MFLIRAGHSSYSPRAIAGVRLVLGFWLVLCPAAWLLAQAQPAPTPTPQKSGQQQTGAPEAGGPVWDIGPSALPQKEEEAAKHEEAPEEPAKGEHRPNFAI